MIYSILLIATQVVSYAQETSTAQIDSSLHTAQTWHTWSTRISTSLTSINQDEQTFRNTGVSVIGNYKTHYNFEIGANLLQLAEGNTLLYQGRLMHRTDNAGISIRWSASDHESNGFVSSAIEGYQYLHEQVIAAATLSMIDFNEGRRMWPMRLGGTYVLGRYGISASINQDLSQLTRVDPLFKIQIVNENRKGNVFSMFILSGAVNQPKYNLQLNLDPFRQFGYGGWTRINVSKDISVSAALSRLNIYTPTDQKITINEFSFSITLQ
jgi:hypothetical protein